ncbi:MAG TPA: hypothetical protein VLE51_03505 [Candidatus Saccharimonadales bacterium]|nr:hypothetical protein [Candidatus Saccharimonadales bacterium]
MDQAAAKQQIVEKIKQANNILVTVSNDPSVDQLSACIGVTLLLNKIDKHATAVFSGKVPSTIEFLQPEKTLEPNTDSLRDFIISLDKNKADKLRYKVEDQFVRIYITPYKSSISQKDLVFSEGDYNVDVVLALGVREKAQLDAAISTHGRILHDATVISINAGHDKNANVGQINWQDAGASSLSEMLVSISEAFGAGLIDNQMATAFLTGIVAETQRFSNKKTSPKVMTMSAQLMAAGANQQLIVSKLEPPPPPPEAAKPVVPTQPPKAPPSDTLKISHDETEKTNAEVEAKPGEVKIDEHGNIVGNAGATTQPPKTPFSPPKPISSPAKEVEVPAEVTAASNPEPVVSTPQPAVTTPEPVLPNLEVTPPVGELPKITPINSEPFMPESIIAPTQPPPEPAKPPLVLTDTEPRPHALLDPSGHQSGPALSADTQPESYDSEGTMPMDPLSEANRPNEFPLSQQEPEAEVVSSLGHSVAPPDFSASPSVSTAPAPQSVDSTTPTFPTPAMDDARSAVQSALASAPYDPAAEGPVVALNAQPINFETPPSPSGNVDVSHSDVSALSTSDDMDRPAPPPVPPPLKLDSGVVIPTTVAANNGQSVRPSQKY